VSATKDLQKIASIATTSQHHIPSPQTFIAKDTMPPKKNKKKPGDGEVALTRIAIINKERCRPKKCNQQCKRSCPVVKLGKLCIEVGPKSKLAFISEPLCIGK
jgi:hypothetical protein